MEQNNRRRTGETRLIIYDFIQYYTRRHGYPPTLKEMAQAAGISSAACALRHVRQLEKDKLLIHDTKKARAVRTAPMD